MPTAPDSKGLRRLVESDVGTDGTFSGLINLTLGWVSGLLDPTDTGWLTPNALNSGWSHHDNGLDPFRYRVKGGDLYLTGRLAKTAAAGVVAFTLPTGFRPARQGVFGIFTGTGTFAGLIVQADGQVILNNSAGTAFTSVQMTVPPMPVS